MKETFLIVPETDIMLRGAVVTGDPPPARVNVIVTLAGGIAPEGNPLPRRVILVIPACPQEGVTEVSDTAAKADAPHALRIVKRRAETKRKNFLRRFVWINIGLSFLGNG